MPGPVRIHYLDTAVMRQQGDEPAYAEITDENGNCPRHGLGMTESDLAWLNEKQKTQEDLSLEVMGEPREEGEPDYYNYG